MIFAHIRSRLWADDRIHFSEDDVYVVWFSFVLESWKALLSTTLPDGMRYEVTYNAGSGETSIASYKRSEIVVFPDRESMSDS